MSLFLCLCLLLGPVVWHQCQINSLHRCKFDWLWPSVFRWHCGAIQFDLPHCLSPVGLWCSNRVVASYWKCCDVCCFPPAQCRCSLKVCVVHTDDIDKSHNVIEGLTWNLQCMWKWQTCKVSIVIIIIKFYSPFMTLETAADTMYLVVSSDAFDHITSSSSADGVWHPTFSRSKELFVKYFYMCSEMQGWLTLEDVLKGSCATINDKNNGKKWIRNI